jgi:hypothetical protein
MDAKFNWLMDSMAARVAINLAAFVAWLALSYALLS